MTVTNKVQQLSTMDLKDLEALAIFMGMAITETIAGNIDAKTLIAVSSATNVLKSILETRDVVRKVKHIEFMLEQRLSADRVLHVGQEARGLAQAGVGGITLRDGYPGGPRPSLRALGRPMEDDLKTPD